VRSASSASSPRAAVLHLVQGSRRAASGAVVSDRTHMNRTARSSVGLQPPVPRQRGRGRSAPRRIPRCGRSANDPAMHLNPTAAMPCRGLKSQQSGSVSGRRPARSGVSMTRPCCRRIGAAAWAGGVNRVARVPTQGAGRKKRAGVLSRQQIPGRVRNKSCFSRTAHGHHRKHGDGVSASLAQRPLQASTVAAPDR
jgi:hypothetical protein